MKIREINRLADLRVLENDIQIAALRAISYLRLRGEQCSALDVLRAVKFEEIGFDPLEPNRQLNLIEQVNQTFTALVSVRAVEYLLNSHAEAAPFTLNLGTVQGTDIESHDCSVAAEVFSATHPNSNGKLRKDIDRVRRLRARHRYVFFHCPGEFNSYEDGDVCIVPLRLERQD